MLKFSFIHTSLKAFLLVSFISIGFLYLIRKNQDGYIRTEIGHNLTILLPELFLYGVLDMLI
jgi:hypothetical protein